MLINIDLEAETWPQFMDVRVKYVRPEGDDEDEEEVWEEPFKFEEDEDDNSD